MPASQAARFVFTFNRTDNDIEQDIPFSIHVDKLKTRLQQSDIDSAVFQVELGEDKSRLHIQGYVKFVKKVSTSFKHLQTLLQLPGAHFEQCKDPSSAIRYCSKEDTRQEGPFFFNLSESQEYPVRSDIRKLISQVKSGVTLGDLAEGDHPQHVLKYHVAIEKLHVSSMPYNVSPCVISHMSQAEARSHVSDSVYITSDGLFDDYESQTIVIWAYHRPPPPGFLFKLETSCKKTLPCKGFLKKPSNIHQLMIIDYPDQKDEKALLSSLSKALKLVTDN